MRKLNFILGILIKPILRTVAVIAFYLLLSLSIRAQVGYTTAITTGNTFTTISGTGTSMAGWRNGTSTDDNLSTSTAIGFNFFYDGATRTTFSVSTNGFLTFNTGTASTGSGAGAYGYDNTVFSAVTGSNTGQSLAPFYDDQVTVGNPGTLGGLNGAMHYQLTGSSPNRVLTVEWTGMEQFGFGGPNLNYQVKLYETTNVIEFWYGTMDGTGNGGFTYSVGVNSLSISATPASSELYEQQAANGSTFNNTVQNGLVTLPTGGTKITFTPLPACVSPTAQPTSLNFSSITSTGLTGTFTAASPAPDTYLIIRSTSSTLSASPVNGTTYSVGASLGGGIVIQFSSALTFTETTLTPATQYYYFIFSANSVCTGGARYLTTSPLTNNATTTSCGSFTTLYWAGLGSGIAGAPGGTDMTVKANWSTLAGSYSAPASDPNACNDLVMSITAAASGVDDIFMSKDMTVHSLAITLTCSGGIFGVKNVYITNYTDATLTAQKNLNVTGAVTQTMTGTGAGAHSIAIELGPGTNNSFGSLTTTFGGSGAGGYGNFLFLDGSCNMTIAGNLTSSMPAGPTGAVLSEFFGGTGQFIINGTTLANSNGSSASARAYFIAGDGGSITFNGDATFDNGTSAANNNIYLAGPTASAQGTGTFIFKGNTTFGARCSMVYVQGLPASLIFDASGAQTVTVNSTVMTGATSFIVGNSNSPTVTMAGSQNLTLNSANTAGVTSNLSINNSAILDLSTHTLNRGATATGTFAANNSSTLKLGATSGGQTGSNFPLNYSSVTLNGSSTVEYNGTSSQTVYGLPTYGNLKINNSAGCVTNATTTVATGLNLASGILTSTGGTVSVTNTAATAITRTASATSDYVDGPLKWSLANGGSYIFPVGNTATYLPYTLATTAASSPIITLQAFKADAGAAATFDATLSGISHTEYWAATLNSGTFTGNVSLGRQAALTTQNVIGKSTAQAGSYTNIGGTASTPNINTSNSVSSLGYFVMAIGNKNVDISSYNTITGAANYCTGSTASPLSATFNTCSSALPGNLTATTVTVTWYYNTTNSTAIPGATVVSTSTNQSTGTGTTVTYTSPAPSTATPGSYYYFCVVSSPSNTECSSALPLSTGTQLVTVYLQPTSSNGGNVTICQGSTTGSLGGNTPSPGSGLWTVIAVPAGGSTGDITFSNATSGSSTATAAVTAVIGGYTLQWKTTNGTCTATSTLILTVNPTPTAVITNVSGITSICSGTPVNLSATSSTANGGTISNYQWIKGGVDISGATGTTYIVTTPGTYSLRVTNSDGCSNTSAGLVISGNTSPTARVTPSGAIPGVCYGSTVTLSSATSLDPSGTINQWQWYNDGVAIVGATSSTYAAPVSGDYTVKVTSSTGCSNTLLYPIDVLVQSTKDYTVASNVPAGITTNPSDYSSGCSPSFTVVATGTGITYQWQISTDGGATYNNISDGAVYSGTTTATLSILNSTGLDGDLFRVVITAPAPCANVVTSTAATFTQTYIWNGNALDGNWNTSGNWTCGVVPNSPIAVVNIPVVSNPYPTIGGASTIAVKNLIIASGASATNNGTLNINGSITGTLTSTGGTVGYVGTAAQTIAANTFAGNTISGLTISNYNSGSGTGNVILGGPLTLTTVLNFGNHDHMTFTTNDNLTLHSDSTTYLTARVGDLTYGGLNNNNVITGNVLVERFINSFIKRAYHLLAPSVNSAANIHSNWQEGANAWYNDPKHDYGTQITGSTVDQQNGFDQTQTAQASLFTINYATGWVKIANTDVLTLDSKTGYLLFVRGNRGYLLNSTPTAQPLSNTTLRAKGPLVTGDVTFTPPQIVTGIWPGGTSSTGQSLVTNPYASPLDWSLVYTEGSNSTNFYQYVNLWDPHLSGQGAYVQVDNLGNNNNFSSTLTNEIQSGSAFFIFNKVNAPASFIVKEKDKSTTANIHAYTPTMAMPKFYTSLYYNDAILGRTNADGTLAIYDNSYCACVNGDDALNSAQSGEDIAILRDGVQLSIEKRPLIAASDTLFIFMQHMKTKAYQWQFDIQNSFDPSLSAVLVDSYLGTRTPVSLTAETIVNFNTDLTVPASIATNRFYIVFTPNGALPVTVTSIRAYTVPPSGARGLGVNVDWTVSQQINMGSYEVERSTDGRSFTHAGTVAATPTTGAAAYSWYDATPNTGANYYRVKVIDRSSASSYTNVVRVDIASAPPAITVYPNPVKGNTFTLQLTNIEKGSYTMQLINKLGQVIYTREINHAGGSGSETITLDRKVAQGTYELKIGSFITELIKE